MYTASFKSSLTAMTAGLLLAAFAVACTGGQDAPEPKGAGGGLNPPAPATAGDEGQGDPGIAGDYVLFGQ